MCDLVWFAGVQWEGDCQFIYETLSSFRNWCNNAEDGSCCGEFARVDSATHWVYCDYTYLHNITANIKDVVDWSQYGFGSDEGADCALWMGTSGAHTVCHQDTYGFNVVLQVNAPTGNSN